MKSTDKEKICAWAEKQTHTQKLFLSRTSHPEQADFDAFARELVRLAPCLKIQSSAQKTALPAIFIADNILLSALPLEKELAPFLEALTYLAGPLPPLADHIQDKLNLLDHPCRLMLFIALQCPHCPDMVRTLIPLAAHAKKKFSAYH